MSFHPNEVVEVWSGVLTAQRTRWRRKNLGYLPAEIVAVDAGAGRVFVVGVDTGTCLGQRWVPVRYVRQAALTRGLDLDPNRYD